MQDLFHDDLDQQLRGLVGKSVPGFLEPGRFISYPMSNAGYLGGTNYLQVKGAGEIREYGMDPFVCYAVTPLNDTDLMLVDSQEVGEGERFTEVPPNVDIETLIAEQNRKQQEKNKKPKLVEKLELMRGELRHISEIVQLDWMCSDVDRNGNPRPNILKPTAYNLDMVLINIISEFACSGLKSFDILSRTAKSIREHLLMGNFWENYYRQVVPKEIILPKTWKPFDGKDWGMRFKARLLTSCDEDVCPRYTNEGLPHIREVSRQRQLPDISNAERVSKAIESALNGRFIIHRYDILDGPFESERMVLDYDDLFTIPYERLAGVQVPGYGDRHYFYYWNETGTEYLTLSYQKIVSLSECNFTDAPPDPRDNRFQIGDDPNSFVMQRELWTTLMFYAYTLRLGSNLETKQMEEIYNSCIRTPRGALRVVRCLCCSNRDVKTCQSYKCSQCKEGYCSRECHDFAWRRQNGKCFPLELFERTCAHCWTQEGKLRCSRCKQTRYCSRECQAGNWKQHKKNCKAQEVF